MHHTCLSPRRLCQSAARMNGRKVDDGDEVVQAAALAAGLRLKRLDRKLERQLVHAHCKALAAQLEAAANPAAALSVAVPLLAAQVLTPVGVSVRVRFEVRLWVRARVIFIIRGGVRLGFRVLGLGLGPESGIGLGRPRGPGRCAVRRRAPPGRPGADCCGCPCSRLP